MFSSRKKGGKKPLVPTASAVFMKPFISVNNYDPAYFGSGTKLTVLEHALSYPTVKVLPPSEHECRKNERSPRKKTLVCVASDFYPDHVSVSWSIHGQKVTDGVQTDSDAQKYGTSYRITSKLRVRAEEWFTPGVTFTCTVAFFNGSSTTFHSDSVIADKSDKGLGRERYLSITQNAKLSYVVLIVKSCLYGAFVSFLVWKLQSSRGKQKN